LSSIILIHGLQGHPYKTWTSDPAQYNHDQATETTSTTKRRGLHFGTLLREKFTSKSKSKDKQPASRPEPIQSDNDQERRDNQGPEDSTQEEDDRGRRDESAGNERRQGDRNPQGESNQSQGLSVQGRTDDHRSPSSRDVRPAENNSQQEVTHIAIDDKKPFIKSHTYWPLDLLAETCPQARISVYGYDTLVVGYARVNKNTLYQIAMDFFHELPLRRSRKIPIIFIAHSLGGLVLKEVMDLQRARLYDTNFNSRRSSCPQSPVTPS